MANGVQKYAVATLTVYFPGGVCICGKCQFADKDRLGRPYCIDTKLVIDNLEERNIGCRLKVVSEDETNNFEDI